MKYRGSCVFRVYVMLCFSGLLSACGGGGGDHSAPTQNSPPPVSTTPAPSPPPVENFSTPNPIVAKSLGIYTLDSRGGTYRDSNIRTYDFVKGYAWRTGWKDLEPEKDVYDFAGIDHIVSRLAADNLKLSWLLLLGNYPDYLLADPDIDTWAYGAEVYPSPWDEDLQERYRLLLTAFAHHEIADPAQGGALVPLKDHSVLAAFHSGYAGLPEGILRENPSTPPIRAIGDYSREKLVALVDESINMFHELFPNTPLYQGFWPLEDDIANPLLWEALKPVLSSHDYLGLFQDNLASYRPCAGCDPMTGIPTQEGMGRTLGEDNRNFSGFQMLSSWEQPFGADHEEKTAFSTPMEGM